MSHADDSRIKFKNKSQKGTVPSTATLAILYKDMHKFFGCP
eukprot:CAMPEP_0177454596 /NCGR_PEP_ID=MMETSP0369-20130122/11459_1 /TAXON_ID=447022 ORGANISM="Scrippsiella hangoei-like, Strain SHHI-4" /NCGR_SAMPLE_ID=MMETSP0369 /ASSEMBLY_ACC=CAM_ASM_000364 /LENGTH=40 /DNA_ID= /DNA_START= /DNA_END= /DNA_ORIENTATION=